MKDFAPYWLMILVETNERKTNREVSELRKRSVVLLLTLLGLLAGSMSAAAIDILDGPEFGLDDQQRFIVTFTTSTASMSQVEYGLTESYGESTSQYISLDLVHEHVLENVAIDSTYHYRIVLSDFIGSEYTYTGTFATPALGQVTRLRVQNTSDKGALLTWDPVFGAAEYQVQRAADESGPFEVIATVTGTEYHDDAIEQVGQNVYRVAPVTSAGVVGEPSPPAASAYVTVDIGPWANNLGIARRQNVSDLSPGVDGDNFGYAAEALPEGDFELLWNNVVVPFHGFYLEQGQNDNIQTNGQIIHVPQGKYSALWLLVSSTWGTSSGINFALIYADGSEEVHAISAPDWCQDGSAFAGVGVFSAARYSVNGEDGLMCSMWLLPPFRVNPNKELVSIRLPQKPPATLGNTNFHIFGLTLGV